MTLQDLQQQYGFDPEVINIWETWEGDTLLPIQEAAIQDHQILKGTDLLVSSPTSSGKTFLAEIAAIHTIYQRKKVIYLVPLKALAEEKFADFSEKYSSFGLDIVISTSDRTEFDSAIERGDFQIAILVFEKANRLLVRNKHFINNCGLLVIDEIQMTSDYSRGSSLEMLLTAILYTRRHRGEHAPTPLASRPQLIALSAVIGDLNRLDQWLGMDVLMSTLRPVELKEGILRKDGTFIYRGFLSQEIGEEYFTPLPSHLTPHRSSYEEKREYQYRRLYHYVSSLVEQGEQVLIFRKWKGLTRETALRLARDLQLPPALQAIEAVHRMEDSFSKEMLLASLRHGVAFHNADLGRDERRAIEQAFKAENSPIRVICATSTLAMGMNLPVNTVIINDLEKPDPHAAIFQEIPLSSAEYKNMSGRAGRLKQHREGRSILFADTPAEEQILWRNYIEGAFPRLRSLLTGSRLFTETLFLLAAGICASEQDLLDFMRHSYAGTLFWNNTPEQWELMAGNIHQAVEFCAQHGLIVTTPAGLLHITEIGYICATQGVSAETFVTLKQLFHLLDPASCSLWELLFIAVHNDELQDLHFRLAQPAYESGEYWRALQERDPDNRETLLAQSETLLQSRFEVTKRIKMSLLLLDWIAGTNLQQLELRYSQFYRDKSYSGVIRHLAENTSWMLGLLAEIASVQHAEPATIQRLRTFGRMALYGVDERGVELAALQVAGVTRRMILKLADAGYTREEHVLDTSLEELERLLPRDIAFRLQDRLYKKYSRTETRHLADQKLRLEHLGYESELLKRVYSAVTLEEFDEAIRQILQTPQIKLIINNVIHADLPAQEMTSADYTVESAAGTIFLRILPPNMRDLQEEQFAHLLAAGMKYAPAHFVLIGRPDFSEVSYSSAQEFSQAYSNPLTLYPAYEICERYVLALESNAPFRL